MICALLGLILMAENLKPQVQRSLQGENTVPFRHFHGSPPKDTRRRKELEGLARQVAEVHNLPARLVLSQIQTESSFRPGAQSKINNRVGMAMGLTQITEAVWQEMVNRGEIPRHASPYDPLSNLMAYAKIMSKLRKSFGDDWPRVVGAYHQGAGQEGVEEPGRLHLMRPFGKDYVMKVFKGMDKEEAVSQDLAHPFLDEENE